MPTILTVTITGLDALKAKLTPALYLDAVKDVLTNASLLAERVARQEAPKDTSALARSITSDVQPMSARVFSTLAYAVPVEVGRQPGQRPPPSAALEGWAKRHGFTGSLFVLARSIGRKGIKARPFMAKAKTAVESAMPGFIQQAASKVGATWKE